MTPSSTIPAASVIPGNVLTERELRLMQSEGLIRFCDLKVGSCFIWMNTEYIIMSRKGAIKFKSILGTSWNYFEFGLNCQMWVLKID